MTSAKETKTLQPVEADDFDLLRNYIPLPNGWEIQTKGKGSTFRLCKVNADGSYERWMVLDDKLHQPLEQMATDLRAHVEQLERERDCLASQNVNLRQALSQSLSNNLSQMNKSVIK